MASLSLSPSTEKPLTPSCFYTGLSPTSFEVGRCRGCHAGRAVWPGEAEILSASIKPLPALAALSTKKKKLTRTNQPLSVTFSLAFLFLACVCGETPSKVLPAVVAPGHQSRDFSPSPASQAPSPASQAQVLPQAGLCSRVLAIICLICQKRRDVLFAQSLFIWRSL